MTELRNRPRNGMAYGVDPTRREFYSLRQARYNALAEDISAIAQQFAARGERLQLLDVGTQDAVALRHVEARPGNEAIDWSIADLSLHRNLYGQDRFVATFLGDLMDGYPDIPDQAYDVVVCEQVLEHLTDIETPIRTLERLLKPGGTLFIGVPTFPHGVHYVRLYGQPWWDRLFPPKKVRGHVQTFSKRRLLQEVDRLTDLQLVKVRGMRIVSGGLLKGLEEKEWWWAASTGIGRALPGLCVEIQAVYRRVA